jgi:hypothetical protein
MGTPFFFFGHFCSPNFTVYSLHPKINNFIRFKICAEINNTLHKHGAPTPHAEATHGCMQMIATKFKRYLSRKEKRLRYMLLLLMSLVCLKFLKTYHLLWDGGNIFFGSQE